MTYEVKINELLADYPRQGETELGESFETTFPEFRNLMVQPRMCGVDGNGWDHYGISTKTQTTGYDGESEAWTITTDGQITSRVDQTVSCIIEQLCLSAYIAVGTGTIAVTISNALLSSVRIDTSSGSTTIDTDNHNISVSVDSTFSGWYRLSIAFTPISAGDVLFMVHPDSTPYPATLDAFQLEKCQSATGFVDRELARYNKLLWKRLTCPRCGYPVKSAGEIFEQSIDGRRVEVCDRCADKE